MSKLQRLSELHKKAAGLNEDLPPDLLNKLTIFGEIYEIMGGLHAEAVGDWRLKEALRRETIATVYSLDPEGTVKDREMKAEFAAKDARKEEAAAEKEATRWKNARDSYLEKINILKKRYDHLKEVARGGV